MVKILERLFLIELAVENIHVDKHKAEDLHVEFKFGNILPCFEVSKGIARGKSCLFCIDPRLLQAEMTKYPIILSVWRESAADLIPEILGQCQIIFPDDMLQLINDSCNTDDTTPTDSNVCDFYPIFDRKNHDIGMIKIALRLTSFGKSILTHIKSEGSRKFQFDYYGKLENSVCESCFREIEEHDQEDMCIKLNKGCDTDDLPLSH